MPAEVLDDRNVAELLRPGGGAAGGGDSRPGGDGGGETGGAGEILGDPARFGLWAFMGTVTMLFLGFTSAYIVRMAAFDWRPLAAPRVIWINTGVLVLSSLTLETARRRMRGWDLAVARRLVAVTGLLGALFVAGQIAACRALAAQGIYLASNPHSSFFYLLTGVHGLHLLGGLIWFAVVLGKVRRMAYTPGEDGLSLFATYWHFLAALWVYLALLLFVI